MTFKKLHHQATPLLIGNVWEVASAKAAEKANFQAMGTSSAAIATMLGYHDGEAMPFAELAFIVKRIAANTELPLSVDLEAGYSRNPMQIVEHIKQLVDMGIVGINLEDTIMEKERQFLPIADFSKTITVIKEELDKANMELFLNVRTDTFLMGLPNPLKVTLERMKAYEKAGADGIFVPFIIEETDIKTVVEQTALPINVMCMPTLPNFDTLQKLGVKRISMGNFTFNNTLQILEQTLTTIQKEQSFQPIFGA